MMHYIGIGMVITPRKLKRAMLVAVALMVVVLVLYSALPLTARSNESNTPMQKRILAPATPKPYRPTAPAHWGLTEKPKCKNPVCTEFIAKEDMVHFRYCIHKTELLKEPQRSLGCRFLNGTGRDPVALASYPGSGNTWVRGLLQGVSGLCTGGIYCDVTLRKRGFPGERIANGTVLVVKTHQTDPWWTGIDYTNVNHTYFSKRSHVPIYSSGIFIVRNPFDAIIAEMNRKVNEGVAENHIIHLEKEEFGENEDWNDWVRIQSLIWKRTVLAWVVDNHNHSVLVIRYEDLKKDTSVSLRRMLDFLQVPYSEQRLQEVITQGFKDFKRKHYEEFDHYTREQREFVRSVINDTLSVLKARGLSSVCNIEEYLEY